VISDLIKGYETYLVEKAQMNGTLKMKDQENKEKEIEVPSYDLQFIRNRSCISMIFDHNITIQIILRYYSSISEVLHGFDLGSSAVGYDGHTVYFTSLGKFSYEMMCNIIDTTRRSLTYERRLEKYFNRGFDIILPNLSMKDIKTHYLQYNINEVCELPFFPFSYNRVDGNKILCKNFHLDTKQVIAARQSLNTSNGSQASNGTKARGSDSSSEDRKNASDYQISDLDEFKIFHLNLYNLVHDKSDLYYMNTQHNLDILDKGPHITRGKIINFYDTLRRKVYRNGRLLIAPIRQYITVVSICEIVRELFPYANSDANADHIIKENEKPMISPTAYLKQIFEKQKAEVLSKYDKIDKVDHKDLPWIMENPGSQLSGSFNPVIDIPEKWYGSYFKSDESQKNDLQNPVKPNKIKSFDDENSSDEQSSEQSCEQSDEESSEQSGEQSDEESSEQSDEQSDEESEEQSAEQDDEDKPLRRAFGSPLR
jgi:hypothetical protein